MKFYKARKDQQCKGECVYEGLIAYGDTMVIVWLNIGGTQIPYTFHPECYLTWHNTMFEHKWGKFQNEDHIPGKRKRVKKPMGRPKKYKSPIKSQRLKASIYYHKKAGNVERVKELEQELSKLSYK